MKVLLRLSTFTLLYFLTFALTSCDVLNPPSEIEWQNNPYDGRNPDVIPEIISINTNDGNEYTNRTSIALHIEFKATDKLRVGEVSSQGENLNENWRDADTLMNLQIQSGDGEKWIGCQAKALNGNESTVKYVNIKLDTRASISSFAWSSTGGDTLVPDDDVTFILQTANDAFGIETGGTATVGVEGWDEINLVGNADGSYTGSYTINRETPVVSNSRVVASFTDRAGNVVSSEADQRLTTWWLPAPGDERTFPLGNSSESIVMCWIPAGSFMMGAQDDEEYSNNNEYPRHEVNIGSGFWLGKYEVTQGQWEAVMGDNPANEGDDHPVYNVSWNEIQDFESELNDAFRLPSESEWEYACRAGTETRFYWGDDEDIDDYAVHYDNNPRGSANVGTKRPNAWGLYDMSGNIQEWCEDWYHSDYTNAPTDGLAWVSPSGSNRVLRGGSWSLYAYCCRSASRSGVVPSGRNDCVGFRLAMDAE